MAEKTRRYKGAVVSVVGPDGVGKSTLIDALLAETLAGPTMRVRNVGILPRRTAPQVPVTEPHKDPPYSTLASLAKVAYVYVDYLLGWWFKVQPFVRRGGWVILERGWWDMAVDPARYRMKLPSWLMWRLGRLLPSPHLLLILEAPPEVVFQRKEELPMHELRRQLLAWREWLPATQRRGFLDASLPARDVLSEANKKLKAMIAGEMGPSTGHVNLPSARNSRWILPQEPARVAAAGLRVYHPVTPKGAVGWHVARALARMGIFGLLPSGHPASPEVEAAVGDWIPTGGCVAVARANHPSRHIVLVLASDGSSVCVIKIASDAAGVKALETEAARISALGERLKPPLRPPRLLEARSGSLVLDPVAWKPRLRPWYLPEDVAAALGAFFAHASNGLGPAGASHGDFAPWNLLETDEGWVVLDWESAAEEGPPWFDLWHFIVQGHALLKRPTRAAIRAGLGGRGWIAAALRAYATAAGLQLQGAQEALVEYLKVSSVELDGGTRDGRAGLEARRRLLTDLGH